VFYVQNLHDNATTRVATFVVRFGPGVGLFVGGMKWFAGTRHMVTKFFGALFFGTLVDTVQMCLQASHFLLQTLVVGCRGHLPTKNIVWLGYMQNFCGSLKKSKPDENEISDI
jgi:hypothetical protein